MMPHTFRRSKLEAFREREIAFVVGVWGEGDEDDDKSDNLFLSESTNFFRKGNVMPVSELCNKNQ